jgi:ABC-type sugar transport system permease subunit
MLSVQHPIFHIQDASKEMSKIAQKFKKHLWSYIFVLPMFILFVSFTIYPLLSSVRYTFYNWNGIGIPQDFVGFKHYISIARDPFFWNAFKNTFIYTGVLVPTQLTIALVLAVILNSQSLKGKSLFRVIFFSPLVTSSAIVGVVISLLVMSGGNSFSQILIKIGLINRPVDWLGTPHTAMWLVIALGVWLGLGYPMIYFLAGLQAINQELYDAARVDGAGTLALFWHITIPLIRPVGIVVLLLTTLHSLRVFDTVQTMTRGGPYFATDVVSTYIYRYAFTSPALGESESNLGFASAAAFFMGLIVMCISIIQVTIARYATTRQKNTHNRNGIFYES